MLSFRVPNDDAAEVQRWADALGIDRSELLRDALHRHLVLNGEADARRWCGCAGEGAFDVRRNELEPDGGGMHSIITPRMFVHLREMIAVLHPTRGIGPIRVSRDGVRANIRPRCVR